MSVVSGLIAQDLSSSATAVQVQNTLLLLDEGCTVPFISRYRKERTGGLDEVAVGMVKELYAKYSELEKRKAYILETVSGQGKLTPELQKQLTDCFDPVLLEDLYLPFKPKKRTRAAMAREKGLEPLAALLMRQDGSDPEKLANRFVDGDKVADTQEALAGASDIMAEWVSESTAARSQVRRTFDQSGEIASKPVKGKEEDPEFDKFRDYFDTRESLRRCPSHRLLALFRGENRGFLRLSLQLESEDILQDRLERIFRRGNGSPMVDKAVADGYKRLIKPSIDTELLHAAKERADAEAIKVFASNLRQLLLASPLGQKRILALDPGFRTGCKAVCLSAQGDLLTYGTIFPHPPQNDVEKSRRMVEQWMREYQIEAIAVGNGTAGRETQSWLTTFLDTSRIPVYLVNEDGASIYSASETAREEFPDLDLTVRGAISIGRRLMDPLAELVKIDPKSIGVGQYQHDVDQQALKKSLDVVVESCVNTVGVSLNTASVHLLTYVSGLGPTLARNIVNYRAENGPFATRRELLKVARLGEKAFEQSAGFLRIENGKNPLDATAVHPESYYIIEKMASDLGVTIGEFIQNQSLRQNINLNDYVTKEVGVQTLSAIMSEISNEERDPRTEQDGQFAPQINSINDLQEGMVLTGVVTNITNFGAFVDLGAKQDGLVHISQMANKYVSNPADIVSLGQQVTVKVLEVDHGRKRIGLSMKALLED